MRPCSIRFSKSWFCVPTWWVFGSWWDHRYLFFDKDEPIASEFLRRNRSNQCWYRNPTVHQVTANCWCCGIWNTNYKVKTSTPLVIFTRINYLSSPAFSDVCSVLDKLYEKSIKRMQLGSPIATPNPKICLCAVKILKKHLSIEPPSILEVKKCRTTLLLTVNHNLAFIGILNILLSTWSKTNRKVFAIIFSAVHNRKQTVFFELLKSWIRRLFDVHIMPLYRGFIDRQNQVACYTDHQFLSVIISLGSKMALLKQAISLKAFNKLSVGDYVTHIDVELVGLEDSADWGWKETRSDQTDLWGTRYSLCQHSFSPQNRKYSGRTVQFLESINLDQQRGKN